MDFFHVGVNPEIRKYTSFVAHSGQYQFLKVSFGLCNSPSVFQRFVNTFFHSLINQGIMLPYMDIIILAKDENDGIVNLQKVSDLASSYGLIVNFKKCQFVKRQVEFLGHLIGNGKISPSPWNQKQLWNFLNQPQLNNSKVS